MEDNRINASIKRLLIGDFGISFKRLAMNKRGEIPFSGMAFYQPRCEKQDFAYKIVDFEAENVGKKKLLYGSSEFAVPTFLYQREDGSYDWITKFEDQTIRVAFHISRDWQQFALYEDRTDSHGEKAFREFGFLFSYAVLNYEACVLHGVVMEYNGMGILITAKAGTGKTTHTRMWRDTENALILNGDRCLCRKLGNIWYAYGSPWSGSSGEYINRKVPIKAIVVLERGQENSIRRQSVYEGTIAMMKRIFAPVWRGTLQEQSFDICEELARDIPILELSCKPDIESVHLLKKAILELKDGK